MSWVFAALLVLVVGAVVVVLVGGGGGAVPATPDRPDPGLPADRRLTGRDLREVRLDTAVRGYRAEEVDDLLARLARELDDRDEQDALAAPGPDVEPGGRPAPGPGVSSAQGPGPESGEAGPVGPPEDVSDR